MQNEMSVRADTADLAFLASRSTVGSSDSVPLTVPPATARRASSREAGPDLGARPATYSFPDPQPPSRFCSTTLEALVTMRQRS
jgi:hypothetical protein